MKFSAVILAGGKSSRMGRDKGLLEVDGQSLLARQIEIVRDAGASEVFVSGRADTDYTAFHCPVLQDRFPNSGPVAGIQTGLAATTTPQLLVLAVDMPHISASVLRQLAMHCTDCTGAIPRVNGAIEPLAAFYPKTTASLAIELLDVHLPITGEGRGEEERPAKSPSAKHFAERCAAAGLATFVDLPVLNARLFTNWNSPADISRLSPAA